MPQDCRQRILYLSTMMLEGCKVWATMVICDFTNRLLACGVRKLSLSFRLSMPICLVILQLASTSASVAEEAKLSAEEAALRHKALMRAHRKRIIETGKNDHAPTPEEYSPELEYYKKQGRRQHHAGQNPSASKTADNQVELRTDIRVETERPSPQPPAGSAQFVSKRMHSESAAGAAGAAGAAANFQADSPAIDFKPYMAALSKKIKQHWTPPARHEKAQVSVNFILMPDGTIGNLQVTKHGSPTADEAARQAILRAAPFAHLPSGCNVPKQINYDFAHSSHADDPSFQWGIH